jgi:hypothetical protein
MLVVGTVVAAASLFVNVEAFKEVDFKKKINSKKCIASNVIINGEIIRSGAKGDPICINYNPALTPID